MKRTFLIIGFALSSVTAFAGGGARFEVTITNLTANQILSPAVVATHTSRFVPMFVPGEQASSELRQIAEDAVNEPMLARLAGDTSVGDFGALDGVIMPGGSRTIVLQGGGSFRLVSLVGMLVTTNDAFYGMGGLRIPSHGSRSVNTPAYDAGTEENNEFCAYIPGPPCGMPLQMAGNGEGFVHVHRGVHGTGDLDAAMWDWRNPVARVTIRRMK